MKKKNNFLSKIIEIDLKKKIYNNRKNILGENISNIITRFPPEPNGFLHIGHVKSLYINFKLAKIYNGICNLRFDDTNPYKSKKKYVNNIIKDIKWLNFKNLKIFYASNYFNLMYKIAKILIKFNYAYIDQQNSSKVQNNKGSFNKNGIHSAWRNRNIKESIFLFKKMKLGKYKNKSLCLRVKISMFSKNLNLRDPIIYRILKKKHFKTKKKWKIYPTYIYAHPIEDAIEYVTHSFCTLEFEEQKPFYNWLLKILLKYKIFKKPLPKQYEFSRLNIKYIITSKRFLKKILKNKLVNHWNDPRMSTISGLKKRGYTPKSIKNIFKNIGFSKNNSLIEYDILENSLRKDLNTKVPRIKVILDPIKLIINNFKKNKIILCIAPMYYKKHFLYNIKKRKFIITKKILIEKKDFKEKYKKNFFRLFPGNQVKLMYSNVIKCIGFNKNKNNKIISINCIFYNQNNFKNKIKGNVHWISIKDFIKIRIYLYQHLFNNPLTNFKKNIKNYINNNSKIKLTGYAENIVKNAKIGEIYQFERQGYFIVNEIKKKIIFYRSVTLSKNNIFKN